MHFPEELMALNRWTVWKYTELNGRITKVPFDPLTGQKSKSNDESTWRSFADSLDAFKHNDEIDGLGFFFKAPFIGIDLDDIDDDIEDFMNGGHSNMVSEFYESFASYAEFSPSNRGIHIIAKGKIPGKRRRKGNVEIYQEGRFFTMTGNSLMKYKNVTEASDETLKRIYDKYFEDNKVVTFKPAHGVTHDLSEAEVVQRILESKQADQFKDFMEGGWQEKYSYGDNDGHSEADLAFANLLAFWCARDFPQMDSLFRQSNLYRDKWDQKRGKTTYGEATLYKAINEIQDVFKPIKKTSSLKYELDFLDNTDQSKDESKKKVNEYNSNDFPQRSWDDTGNGHRFLDQFGDIVKYVYAFKKFFVYDGTRWTMDDLGLVQRLINRSIDSLSKETVKISKDLTPEEVEEVMKKWQKFITTSRATPKKKNVAEEIKPNIAVKPESFDMDDMLLNVANGYLDLSSGELLSHDKDKLFSKITTSEYSTNFSPDTWISFLNDIFEGDQDLIKYMQKAVGYSLTGSTKEQVMFVLLGSGRNGKSLFVNTIAEILGDYTKNIRATSLMAKQSEGINNDIAALQSARLVTSTEPNEGFRFDEGLIKQLTGGDPITARFLYGEDFQFTPRFKLWLTTNYKPIINGTDDGIWRRIVLIPFDVQIPANKVDKDLKYKLLREAPGIIDWALEGAMLWQKEGLEMPSKIKKASVDYRTEMDILERFIDDECIVGDGESIRAKEFYQAYKKWAEENNEYAMNNNKFGGKMKEKFTRSKDRNGWYYSGITKRRSYEGLNAIL